jgi:hypothetical protein
VVFGLTAGQPALEPTSFRRNAGGGFDRYTYIIEIVRLLGVRDSTVRELLVVAKHSGRHDQEGTSQTSVLPVREAPDRLSGRPVGDPRRAA